MHTRLAAALSLGLLLSQGVQARSLTIATWNLGWLTLRPVGDPALPARVGPKRPEDLARLAGYAAALHADIVAIQGVDSPQAAAMVFPADTYIVHLATDQVLQRSGFATRRDLPTTAEPDATDLDPYPDAKFHLRSGADLGVRLSGGRRCACSRCS